MARHFSEDNGRKVYSNFFTWYPYPSREEDHNCLADYDAFYPLDPNGAVLTFNNQAQGESLIRRQRCAVDEVCEEDAGLLRFFGRKAPSVAICSHECYFGDSRFEAGSRQ